MEVGIDKTGNDRLTLGVNNFCLLRVLTWPLFPQATIRSLAMITTALSIGVAPVPSIRRPPTTTRKLAGFSAG
ncbi:MAG: hypothetical protein ACUVR0_07875 [Candidatus Aminicenantales bacterium]